MKKSFGKKKKRTAGLWPSGSCFNQILVFSWRTLKENNPPEFLLWCNWTKDPHWGIIRTVHSWSSCRKTWTEVECKHIVPPLHLRQLLVMSTSGLSGYLQTFWIKYDFILADLWNTFSSGPNAFMSRPLFLSFFLFLCKSKLRFPLHILLLMIILIKRHSTHHVTDFPKKVCTQRAPKKPTSIYNFSSRFLVVFWPLLLVPYVHLLPNMQHGTSGLVH